MYTLQRDQVLPTTLPEAWDFLSNPYNLREITPPEMGFEVLDDIPEQIYSGLLIRYHVRVPVLGQQLWVTEIKHVREGRSFVDEQRIGPYRFWYHYHEIAKAEEGVKFIDQVSYALPYGPLGRIAQPLFVRRSLENIFNYRREVFSSLFP
jgi:ligand-binding SRPBCC domain-containing protein